MSSIRGTLLQWLLHDVAPRTLVAAGLAERAAALRSAARGASNVSEQARLLAAVRDALEHLGALEISIWAAVAALSCAERLLSEDVPGDALIIAISARVAEHAGIELPRLVKTTPASRRGAA